MTTVRPVPTVGAVPPKVAPADAEGGDAGERQRRRRHRRLVREELLTVGVLLLALVVTLVVLGLQWLDSGQPNTASAGSSYAVGTAIHTILGGHT